MTVVVCRRDRDKLGWASTENIYTNTLLVFLILKLRLPKKYLNRLTLKHNTVDGLNWIGAKNVATHVDAGWKNLSY